MADHLLDSVAVDSLSRRVPGHDRPVQRLAEDGVVRGLDNRPKKRALLRRPPPLADIADNRGDERALLLPERTETDLDRELAPVLAPSVQLQPHSHRPRARGGGVARPMIDVGGAGALGEGAPG